LLYAIDATYGWSRGMRAISHALLAEEIAEPQKILEIGCGTGTFLQEIAHTQHDQLLVGADRHPLALAHAQQRAATDATDNALPTVQFVQSDLQQLPFADQQFSLILAFDVYDQKGVTLAMALQESHRVLQVGGQLLLRVSAYPWLMGVHDAAFNTAQRFRRRTLLQALTCAGFSPVRITYANALLAPPVIALRLLQRWSLLPHTSKLYTDSFTNHLLAALLHGEARWLRHHNLPGGISLYVQARKEA